jgi:Flp pilus assembly protein TadB
LAANSSFFAIFVVMIFSFFKTPKHQRFTYNPRYYNPEEEERQERLRKARGEQLQGDAGVKRINFKRQSADYQSSARQSNRNVVFLIFIISALFFLIFSDYISLQTAILVMALLIAWRTGVFSRLLARFKKLED